jgi:hypothetical protein
MAESTRYIMSHIKHPYQHNKSRDNNCNPNLSPVNTVQQPNQIKISVTITTAILEYIYSIVDLSQYKYRVIEYESELTFLLQMKYFVTPNFVGKNSLLVFTRIHGQYHTFLIEKKQLSYNPSLNQPENIQIFPLRLRLDNSIYDGTIFEGTRVQNKRSRQNAFIITDAYSFRGVKLENENIDHKLMNISAYLAANLHPDNHTQLMTTKLYNLFDLQSLVSDMEKYKEYDTKGIAFISKLPATKYIFLNQTNTPSAKNMAQHAATVGKTQQSYGEKDKDTDKDIEKEYTFGNGNINATVTATANIPVITRNTQYSIIPNSDAVFPLQAAFEMRKTDQPDVYELFVVSGPNKLKKIDYAHIPDMASSIMCKSFFVNKNIALVSCTFSQEKLKWIPTKLASATMPTALNILERNLVITRI